MYSRRFRPHNPKRWHHFNRLALAAIIAQCALLWFAAPSAWAEDKTRQNLAPKPMLVTTVRATARNSYSANRTYAGRVVAGRSAELGFRFPGTLASVAVDLGSKVAAGDILAELDNASRHAAVAQARAAVSAARANIAAVEAETELAKQTAERFTNLRRSGHVSAQENDEQQLTLKARQAQSQVATASLAQRRAAQRAAEVALQEAFIAAPFAGVVQARYADEGSQITPGAPVLRLVETSNKEAHIGVPEALAATLSIGMQHQLLWSGQRIDATLSAVLPEVDLSNRTLTAVYQLSAQPAATAPIGAVVELALASEVPGNGFWVPLTALTESERGLWGLYVVNDKQILERRLVEIVHADNQRAFVRGTLKTDDRVVATGIQRLVPGQRVTDAGAAGAAG
ncbi:MAG: efflux RND transporter periplasmic adaptor subunit [Pseudomonadales bacterium]